MLENNPDPNKEAASFKEALKPLGECITKCDNGTPGVTKAELTHAIRNDRRRAVIEVLDYVPEIPIKNLADEVTKKEVGDDYSSKQRSAVYIALYQEHLETLDDLQIVNWEGCSRTPVTRGSEFIFAAGLIDALDKLFKTDRSRDDIEYRKPTFSERLREYVANHEPIQQSELSEEFDVSKKKVSVYLSDLQERGDVVTWPDPTEPRRNLVGTEFATNHKVNSGP